jgi:hypothetical protein
MRDPRTPRFLKLRKRDPGQLSPAEALEVQEVCELMMEYVGSGRLRKPWEELAEQYSAIADQAPGNRHE